MTTRVRPVWKSTAVQSRTDGWFAPRTWFARNAPRDHVPRDALGEHERRPAVHGDALIEGVRLHVQKTRHGADAGGVHGASTSPASAASRRTSATCDRSATTQGPAVSHVLLERSHAALPRHDANHARAAFGEPLRASQANAARRAGDERGLSSEGTGARGRAPRLRRRRPRAGQQRGGDHHSTGRPRRARPGQVARDFQGPTSMGAGTVSRNRWGSHRGVREGPALDALGRRRWAPPMHSGMEVRVRVGQRRLSRSRMGFGALRASLGPTMTDLNAYKFTLPGDAIGATYTPTSHSVRRAAKKSAAPTCSL